MKRVMGRNECEGMLLKIVTLEPYMAVAETWGREQRRKASSLTTRVCSYLSHEIGISIAERPRHVDQPVKAIQKMEPTE